MFSIFRSNRSRPTVWARRVALFALIALEMAVALSPLLEPHHAAGVAHVEQTGATHQFLVHNDETCAVCTLRSLRTLHSTTRVVIPTAAPTYVATQGEHVIVLARDVAAHAPRAPPITG